MTPVVGMVGVLVLACAAGCVGPHPKASEGPPAAWASRSAACPPPARVLAAKGAGIVRYDYPDELSALSGSVLHNRLVREIDLHGGAIQLLPAPSDLSARAITPTAAYDSFRATHRFDLSARHSPPLMALGLLNNQDTGQLGPGGESVPYYEVWLAIFHDVSPEHGSLTVPPEQPSAGQNIVVVLDAFTGTYQREIVDPVSHCRSVSR